MSDNIENNEPTIEEIHEEETNRNETSSAQRERPSFSARRFFNGIQSGGRSFFTGIRHTWYRIFQRRKCPYCLATIINSHQRTVLNSTISYCSECRKDLPTDFFKHKSRVIALVGGPDTGKTTYITVLTHQLLSNGAVLSMLNLHAGITDREGKRIFQKNDEKLFVNNSILDTTIPTDDEVRHPIVIKLVQANTNKRKILFLSLFDTPGDEFNDANRLTREHPHISNADAILYLTDPLNIRGIYDELRLTKSGPLFPFGDFQTDFDIINNIYTVFARENKTKKGKIEIPISFCISKADILDYIATIYMPEEIDSELIQLNDILEEAKYTSDDLYDFLMEKDARLVRNLESQFRYFEFFPVAPIGKNVDESGMIHKNITPKGVLHPLIWILQQLKFI